MEEILSSYYTLNKIIGSNKNYSWHKQGLDNLVGNFFVLYICQFPRLEREILLLANMLSMEIYEQYKKELESEENPIL